MKLFTIILVLLTLPMFAFGQTVHQVAEGTGVISAALAGAAAGDIIELTTSGGTYADSNSIVISFGVTIRAADGLAEKPVIYSLKGWNFFQISPDLGNADEYWFNLEGVVVDGLYDNGTDTTWAKSQTIGTDDGAAWHCIKVEDCVIQNMYAQEQGGGWGGKFMWPGGNTYADSIIFTNNIIQHWARMGGDLFFFRNSSQEAFAGAGYILIENSTFWDAGLMVLEIAAGTNEALSEEVSPEVMVRNLTISGLKQPWSGWNVKAPGSIIKNVIQSGRILGESRGEFNLGGAGTIMSYTLLDSTGTSSAADGAVIDSATCMFNVNPLFVDAENGNFDLYSNSPAVDAGDDGANLGDPRWATDPGTSIKAAVSSAPAAFKLNQNYPNPFNPVTKINYDIKEAGRVTLNIYNALGQLVATLIDNNVSAGSHTAIWNASSQVSGVYFYRLASGNNVQVRKMILIK